MDPPITGRHLWGPRVGLHFQSSRFSHTLENTGGKRPHSQASCCLPRIITPAARGRTGMQTKGMDEKRERAPDLLHTKALC